MDAHDALPEVAPAGFVEFFRGHYRTLVRVVILIGADPDEAEDAAASVMEEVLRRWNDLADPLAYARRAVRSNFIKHKTRGLDRTRDRQVRHAAGTPQSRADPNQTVWEDGQWVIQLLRSLPQGQRDVLAFVVDGFTPAEIAELLGRSPEAVRQSLHEARKRLKRTLEQKRSE